MNTTHIREARGRRFYIAENALASFIFSLGTGSFMAGLLSYMGVSPAACALIGAFPQLGCIMQLVSPFLFERLERRKPSIIFCCFCFRFLLGLSGVYTLLTNGGELTVMPLYLAAFLMAGFVSPGLNQWNMSIAPRKRRGRFFATRDIVSAVCNAAAIFAVSRALDDLIASGREREGYMLVFGAVLVLSVADAILLMQVHEPQGGRIHKLMPGELLVPFGNRRYRPIIVFIVLWFFTQNLSSGFMAVYQLTVLKMDYSMIAMMTMISSAVSIVMSWVWGRVADRMGWKRLLMVGCLLMLAGYAGWSVLPGTLIVLAPVLQSLTTAGSSAYNMSSLNIQYALSPQEGKTVYLGLTAAVSNLTGYAAVWIGSQVQPVLAGALTRQGIPALFAVSAAGFCFCAIYARRIADV